MGIFQNIVEKLTGTCEKDLLQAEDAGVDAGRDYARKWQLTSSEDVSMLVLDELTDQLGSKGDRRHMYQVGFLEGVDGWQHCETCQGYWPVDHECDSQKQSKL